ncbi:MAG: hypothetical protein ACPG65_03125, partial [Porticoccaceae bacterium]
TDYSSYGNRVWIAGSGDVTGDYYDQCGALNLTVVAADADAVRLTGPWWGWDPAGGPVAADNGDGSWTVTLGSVPTENMEYLWVVDGTQESLIDNAANSECAANVDGGTLITDYSSYGNRVWIAGSGDVKVDYSDACAGP